MYFNTLMFHLTNILYIHICNETTNLQVIFSRVLQIQSFFSFISVLNYFYKTFILKILKGNNPCHASESTYPFFQGNVYAANFEPVYWLLLVVEVIYAYTAQRIGHPSCRK